jgi:hypothetical protein
VFARPVRGFDDFSIAACKTSQSTRPAARNTLPTSRVVDSAIPLRGAQNDEQGVVVLPCEVAESSAFVSPPRHSRLRWNDGVALSSAFSGCHKVLTVPLKGREGF